MKLMKKKLQFGKLSFLLLDKYSMFKKSNFYLQKLNFYEKPTAF